MSDATPVAYVETNWVVAAVVRHDRLHRQAFALHQAGSQGQVRTRIPQIAVVEATQRIATKVEAEIVRPVRDLRAAISRAAEVDESIRKSLPLEDQGGVLATLEEYSRGFSGLQQVRGMTERVLDGCERLESSIYGIASVIHPELEAQQMSRYSLQS